jgi:hypothetical protein
MNAVVDKIGISLGEASTWRAIVVIITLIGVQLDPEQTEAIAKAGAALFAALGLFSKRKPSAG